eukprot:TRINITY_DN2107_c0_g3_i1.p1 TRINITY_DN2107_c0_g3~~TRINITY_DN2107_c0_g3_i1.p1  ORF type:complete len:257 (-),score=97.85 TRINITY_DN2107_c0_g3_i1:321-1091(-)
MSNHKEEQELEVEALTAIFTEGKEFVRVSDSEFLLKLLPDSSEETVNHVRATLRIKYTDEYPDEAPDWSLEDMDSLPDEKQGKLKEAIEEVVSSSLGMAMVYSMAEACQEYLKENNVKALSMHEEMMKRLGKDEGGGDDEEAEGGDDDEDEEPEEEEWKGLAEKPLCPEKDRITVDSFNAWRAKFEEEMIEAGVFKKTEEKGKSGKLFFLEAREKEKAEATAGGKDSAKEGTPLVYDASLFGEVDDDDDLDDLDED